MMYNFEDYRPNSYCKHELTKHLTFVTCLLCCCNWPGFTSTVVFIPSMNPAMQRLFSQF